MISFKKHKYLGTADKPTGGWNSNKKLIIGEFYEILAEPGIISHGQNGNAYGLKTSVGFIEYNYPQWDYEGGNEEKLRQQIYRDWESEEHEAVRLLIELVDSEDGECIFDHHGNCQEHNCWREDNTCSTADARKLLGLV